jgi:hypothetical protein
MNEQQAAQGQLIVDVMDHGCGFGELGTKPSCYDNGNRRIAGR